MRKPGRTTRLRKMKLTLEEQATWLCTVLATAGMDAIEMEARFREVIAEASGSNRTMLAKGVKQAINDLYAHAAIWLQAGAIDAALAGKGLPGLEEMEAQLNRAETKMLKRGTIQTTEEFYMAMNLLNNLESDLTKKQRIKLEAMVSAFEKKVSEAKSNTPDG